MNKSQLKWIVNVVSFVLCAILTLTGLINWWLLPRGFEARGSFLIDIRHFFTDIHEWTALLFLISIGVHIWLHWNYVSQQLTKMRKGE